MATSSTAKQQDDKMARFAPKVTLTSNPRRSWRLSKIIGSLAGSVATILAIWVLFFQSDQNIAIDLNAVSTTDDGRLELQGLTYRGKTQSGAPFEVTAVKATEDNQDPQIVNLTTVTGQVDNQEQGLVTLASHQGRFHRTDNIVDLSGDVVITQQARDLIFETQILTGDLNQGYFEAPEDVDVSTPNSSITAQAMVATQFGDRIVFKGQSKAIIQEEK